MIEPDELRRVLEAAFPGCQVQITDLTGTRDHYQLNLVAEAFRGKPRVETHRMVNAALADEFAGGLHALAIEAKAPG